MPWEVMHETIDFTRVAGIPSSCQVPRSTGSPELGRRSWAIEFRGSVSTDHTVNALSLYSLTGLAHRNGAMMNSARARAVQTMEHSFHDAPYCSPASVRFHRPAPTPKESSASRNVDNRDENVE